MSQKIQHKLTVLFGLVIVINLLALYFFLDMRFKAEAYQRVAQSLERQSHLAVSYAEAMIEKNPQAVDWNALADHLGSTLEMRATIITADGNVVGDSDFNPQQTMALDIHDVRPEVLQALENGAGTSRRYSLSEKRDMIYRAVAFSYGTQKIVLRLSIPETQIEDSLLPLRNSLKIALLVVLILCLVFSYLISIRFSRPLVEIAKVANKIAHGDFSEKIHLPRKDVIGNLAETLNHMSEEVHRRIQEINLGKSRWEAVLSSMTEGVLVVDRQNNILFINESLKDLLAIFDEPIGRKALEVIRHVNVQEIITRANSLKEGVVISEVSFLFPKEKIVLVHAAPIVFQRQLEGVVLVFHNITELKRLEKVRQEFVANVSHELRTPIASIKGYAETLLSGALDDKENARDFVNIIYTDAERLARLIEDILDLSRIESGNLNMAFKSCELFSLVERTASGFSKSIAEKKLLLQNHVSRQLPKVQADDDRLAQVFLNLIDNAVKYTPVGGKIIITAEEKEKFIHVHIQDTGIGIPEEDQLRIFERFYRVDKARSRDLGGTGLGLAIVKHIIQAHRGEVSIRSQLGKGSVFSFTLPKAV